MFTIFIILVVGVALEYFFKETKAKKIVYFLCIILFFTIQAFNTWSPDRLSYETHFYNLDKDYVSTRLEPIHRFLIEIVHYFEGDFEDFILIYAGITLLFFFLFLYRVSPLPVLVLSYFFIIPYYLDLVQIRSFLALSIFLVSLLFLGRRKLWFWIFYALSVMSHFSMLIFIPFLLIRNFTFYNNLKKSNIIIIIGMILLLAVPKDIADPIITAINPKYSLYLEATSSYIGTIVLFSPFFILNNMVIWHYNRHYKSLESYISKKYKRYIPLFIQLIIFANYLILAQYFIRDFSRITMNLSLLSFIYLSVIFFYSKKTKLVVMRNMLSKVGLYIWAIVSFYLIFLLLNDGKYMETIEQTFLSNRFYGE